MVISVILLLIGLVLIIKGGDFFVDAAAWMAEKTGIPKMVVGATIVSLATTLPEILVSLIAAAGGSVDMAIGNAVGSVTANIGLIMGIAMLFMPGKIALKDYWMKFLLMLVAAVLVVIGGVSGGVNLPMATILVIVVAVFFADNIRIAIKAHREEKAGSGRKAGTRAGAKTVKTSAELVKSRAKVAKTSAKTVKLRAGATVRGKLPLRERVWWNILKFVLGAAGIVGGAELLVNSGSDIATALGVSERIISVTLIAVGTSLPELVTTISAIIKKEKALSFGNVLGANIIDLALIMPLCAFVSGKTLPIATTSAAIDLPACLIVAAIAIVPTIFSRKFSRWQGALLVLAYVAYLVVTSLVTVG